MTRGDAKRPADSDLDYCLDLIRRGDRDRYLTVLLAPAAARAALLAIYAFKHEVEKTHAVVSEPMLGQIRLQWWRESLDGVFSGAARRHAVVTPLAAAVVRCGLPRAPFDAIVDGHERDLDSAPFATMDALRAYCDAVEGSLIALAMAASRTGPPDERARALATEAGIGFGIARLLRRMGANLRSGPLPIPSELAEAHGIDSAALRQIGPDDPRLRRPVAELVAVAGDHLQAARRALRHGRGVELPALLHCALGHGMLARVTRAGYNPFDARVIEPAAAEPWRLLHARIRGRAALPRC